MGNSSSSHLYLRRSLMALCIEFDEGDNSPHTEKDDDSAVQSLSKTETSPGSRHSPVPAHRPREPGLLDDPACRDACTQTEPLWKALVAGERHPEDKEDVVDDKDCRDGGSRCDEDRHCDTKNDDGGVSSPEERHWEDYESDNEEPQPEDGLWMYRGPTAGERYPEDEEDDDDEIIDGGSKCDQYRNLTTKREDDDSDSWETESEETVCSEREAPQGERSPFPEDDDSDSWETESEEAVCSEKEAPQGERSPFPEDDDSDSCETVSEEKVCSEKEAPQGERSPFPEDDDSDSWETVSEETVCSEKEAPQGERSPFPEDDDSDSWETVSEENVCLEREASPPLKVASAAMGIYCFEVLMAYLWRNQMRLDIPFTNDRHPVFVTWTKGPRQLNRGSAGTFDPTPLREALKWLAIKSASDDKWRLLISRDEVDLQCSVSILYDIEQVDDPLDWEIGVHGISISLNGTFWKTFLPEVASDRRWTKQKTVEQLLKKTGYQHPVYQELLDSLHVRRFRTERATATMDDYAQAHCPF